MSATPRIPSTTRSACITLSTATGCGPRCRFRSGDAQASGLARGRRISLGVGMPRPIALFGATGSTGRLTAEAVVARGARPILCGRDSSRAADLADNLGGLLTGQRPDEGARDLTGSDVAAVVRSDDGTILDRQLMRWSNAYDLTADLLAWGAIRSSEHLFDRTGALGPVGAFGLSECVERRGSGGMVPVSWSHPFSEMTARLRSR